MADPYRWGGVTPPSVALIKRRRVHRDSLKRRQEAGMAGSQAEMQSPYASCAQAVARAVCAEQARQERTRRPFIAQLGDA